MSNDNEIKRMVRNLFKALRYLGYIGFIGIFLYFFALCYLLLGFG